MQRLSRLPMGEPMTIKDAKTLYSVLNQAIEGKSVEFISAEAHKSGTRLNLLSRALGRYHAAMAAAPRFNLIGVGAISFAQARLAKFCARVGLSA